MWDNSQHDFHPADKESMLVFAHTNFRTAWVREVEDPEFLLILKYVYILIMQCEGSSC